MNIIFIEMEVSMFFLISVILFFQEIFLWVLLIQYKKSTSDEEQFIEDNLQMEYLRNFLIRKKKFQ